MRHETPKITILLGILKHYILPSLINLKCYAHQLENRCISKPQALKIYIGYNKTGKFTVERKGSEIKMP